MSESIVDIAMAPFYLILDSTLGVLFRLSGSEVFNVLFGVFAISTILSGVILYITSKIIDPKEMKSLKERMAKSQERMKEAQTKGDTKELNKIQKELLQFQSSMMSMSMRPMLYTMLPIRELFTWLGRYPVLVEAVTKGGGHIVKLP
ncbi:MAG: DUF4199 family protein, partial [Euryarchaeota archaeon]|nr:DUF4199 family protein [Euryarchaeota archaeon]